MGRQGLPEGPWPAPQAVHRTSSRLKRVAAWFYGHASNVGVFTALVAVVGSVYILATGDSGPNIVLAIPGVALIGLFFFAAGALVTALVGALFDLSAYMARRISKVRP